MKKVLFLTASVWLTASISFSQSSSISGFTSVNAKQQKDIEKQFDQNLSADHISSTIKLLSSKPHHLGSPGGKMVADTIFNRLKSYVGMCAWILIRFSFPHLKHECSKWCRPPCTKLF